MFNIKFVGLFTAAKVGTPLACGVEVQAESDSKFGYVFFHLLPCVSKFYFTDNNRTYYVCRWLHKSLVLRKNNSTGRPSSINYRGNNYAQSYN